MVAGFGQNIVLTTVTTFILVYLLQYAHISVQGLAVVTVIITVAKLVDAVSDPVMGSLVDMTRTRWGKMRPYILFSAAPVAVLSTLLFAIPDISEAGKLVFFGVCYFLWGFAYTVCDVPFWGLIGSAFPDSTERTGVISHVRAFGAIALGLATLGMPWLALAFSFTGRDHGHGLDDRGGRGIRRGHGHVPAGVLQHPREGAGRARATVVHGAVRHALESNTLPFLCTYYLAQSYCSSKKNFRGPC